MAVRGTGGVGALTLGVVLALWLTGMGWLLWPSAGGDQVRAAQGTVVQAVLCGSPDARDGLRVELLDGREVPALLDGCGHQLGEELAVEVPDPLPDGDVVARIAGTGPPASTSGGRHIGGIGVTVAGIAGALLAWRLHRHPAAAHRRVGR